MCLGYLKEASLALAVSCFPKAEMLLSGGSNIIYIFSIHSHLWLHQRINYIFCRFKSYSHQRFHLMIFGYFSAAKLKIQIIASLSVEQFLIYPSNSAPMSPFLTKHSSMRNAQALESVRPGSNLLVTI